MSGDWNEKLPDFINAPALPPRKSSRVGVIKPSAIVSPQQHYSPAVKPIQITQPYKQQPENPYNLTMMEGALKVICESLAPKFENNLNDLQGISPPAPQFQPPQVQQVYQQMPVFNMPVAALKPLMPVIQSPQFQKPQAPQPINSVASTAVDAKKDSLSDAEWYWGNISRDEVKEKLLDACDGTFLVRDASSGCGEYTLTLKKDGTDRVIKIYHNNGKYGFTKDCIFDNVIDLINFYRGVSLKEYNTILDVKLLNPVSRFVHDDESSMLQNDLEALVARFVEVQSEIKQLTNTLEQNYDLNKKTEYEIGIKRQAHDAFIEAETMFQEQMQLQDKYRKEAQPHELKKLEENR